MEMAEVALDKLDETATRLADAGKAPIFVAIAGRDAGVPSSASF